MLSSRILFSNTNLSIYLKQYGNVYKPMIYYLGRYGFFRDAGNKWRRHLPAVSAVRPRAAVAEAVAVYFHNKTGPLEITFSFSIGEREPLTCKVVRSGRPCGRQCEGFHIQSNWRRAYRCPSNGQGHHCWAGSSASREPIAASDSAADVGCNHSSDKHNQLASKLITLKLIKHTHKKNELKRKRQKQAVK